MPTLTSYTVTGLTSGEEYKFTVSAYNYNEASDPSSTEAFFACIAPSGFSAPYLIDSSLTDETMTIGWTVPTQDGGCPITGYAVYMDDGTGSSIYSEVNTASDPAVRDKPWLS